MSQTAPTTPSPTLPSPGDGQVEGSRHGPFLSFLSSLRPTWSSSAALRAVRATIVIPGLFALSGQVLHNEQMALFATFGGFATLVFASFGGNRRDKLAAYVAMGLAGTALITIGTVVNATTALAAIVTVPVAFVVLFAGVVGPNAALGATAVMLTYVLPAASPGTIGMVPSRLEGWWLAVATATVAVMLLSPRPAARPLGAAAARAGAAISSLLDAVLAGGDRSEAALGAERAITNLQAAFTAVPYRPTGVADPDRSLGQLVESLEWTADLAADLSGDSQLFPVKSNTDPHRTLVEASSRGLRDTAALLEGSRVAPSFAAIDAASEASWEGLSKGTSADGGRTVDAAYHAQMVAAATRSVVVDAIGASRVDRTYDVVAKGTLSDEAKRLLHSAFAPVSAAWRMVRGHASVRSVWTRNSARGAVALAGAIAVADLVPGVQHGFWVVLAALSVLRTSESSIGATALRGILGTAVGFFIGAGIVVAIGYGSNALWAALPLAVLIAAYTPGTVTFSVGQAAFTVSLSVLYNILVPIGWKVGVLRLEDVAIGAGVSVVVGLLFWPRGAVTVVADDLADAFHAGGIYLTQSASWALGARKVPPEAGPSQWAEERLEDAMRAMLTEQGTKRVPKEQLWLLVAGTLRLRLSAQSLARFTGSTPVPDATRVELVHEAVEIAGRCDGLATILGRPQPTVARELAILSVPEVPQDDPSPPIAVLVRHLFGHIQKGLTQVMEPARVVGARRAGPWWR